MIKRIYVDNYKCLVNFELRPGEITLLLGGNGSGKSAVFDVVYAVREILSGSRKINDPETFPARTLTKWQRGLVQTVEIDVELPSRGLMTYRLEIEHAESGGTARVLTERLNAPSGPLFEFERGSVQLYRDNHSAGPQFKGDWSESWLAKFNRHEDNPRPAEFLEFVRNIVVCGAYPRGMRGEARSEDAVLSRDASNFAAWYRSVAQERQDLYPKYKEALEEVLDSFAGLRLEKVGPESRVFTVSFESRGVRYELPLDELSDGQRALILLYALLHVAPGHTLLLDEPDNYVALAEIQPWLMELYDACGEDVPQAILCSHHPELIDYLGPESGLLLERQDAGPTTVRPVTEKVEDNKLKLSENVARGWL